MRVHKGQTLLSNLTNLYRNRVCPWKLKASLQWGEQGQACEQREVDRAASGNSLTWKIPNFTNVFTVMMDREGAPVGSKHGMRNSCMSDVASGDSLPNLFTITESVGTAKT